MDGARAQAHHQVAAAIEIGSDTDEPITFGGRWGDYGDFILDMHTLMRYAIGIRRSGPNPACVYIDERVSPGACADFLPVPSTLTLASAGLRAEALRQSVAMAKRSVGRAAEATGAAT